MKTMIFRAKLASAASALALIAFSPARAAKPGATSTTEIFQVTATTKIAVGENRHARLADLKVGDPAGISYDQQNGALVARHISQEVPRQPKRPKVAPHVPARKTPPLVSHVRGIVTAIDPQADTVTITAKAK